MNLDNSQKTDIENLFGLKVIKNSDSKYGVLNSSDEVIVKYTHRTAIFLSDRIMFLDSPDLFAPRDKPRPKHSNRDIITLIMRSENLAELRYNKKSKLINRQGKVFAIYDYIEDFKGGIFLCVKDGQYGYIDDFGEVVAPCIYDSKLDIFTNCLPRKPIKFTP